MGMGQGWGQFNLPCHCPLRSSEMGIPLRAISPPLTLIQMQRMQRKPPLQITDMSTKLRRPETNTVFNMPDIQICY